MWLAQSLSFIIGIFCFKLCIIVLKLLIYFSNVNVPGIKSNIMFPFLFIIAMQKNIKLIGLINKRISPPNSCNLVSSISLLLVNNHI